MRRIVLVSIELIALILVINLMYGKTAAATPNISKSYNISGNIINGTIVSTSATQSNYVVPGTIDNDKRLLGVIVKSNDSLLAIDAGHNTEQVAITGNASTLVSDVNGSINIGDEITVSPFSGIGMKKSDGYRVVGVAESNFNSKSPGVGDESVKDNNGVTHKINVGYIYMTIDIGSGAGTGAGGNQPNLLQRLVKDITGHTISTARIIIALVVAILSLIILVTMIFAPIHGGIISVGRNPLAKTAIYKSLVIVLVMALVTVTVASSAIYFLLN